MRRSTASTARGDDSKAYLVCHVMCDSFGTQGVVPHHTRWNTTPCALGEP
jgi:hypothetical protein